MLSGIWISSTISPPGAIRQGGPPSPSAAQMWPSASSAMPSGAKPMLGSISATGERLGDDHQVPREHGAVGEPEVLGGDVDAAIGVDAGDHRPARVLELHQ